MNDLVTLIRLAAGALTTVAYLPQVIKIWRSKSSGDLSLLMISFNCTGIFLWLLYGIFLRSLPIILANSVTLVLLCIVLALTIKHR
jgi:MtN3 and saliva related transmembrane protein